MPIPRYGVLIGRATDRRLATPSSNHYEIRIAAANESFRIAVNVQSQDGSEVLYAVDETFDPAIASRLAAMADGFHTVQSQPGGIAIDFVRGNFITRDQMEPLPPSAPGNDNDLNDKIDELVQRAIGDGDARVYAYGSFFRNPGQRDSYFGFRPTQGIHDVHMNQGNSARWRDDDGVWQDGALLFRFGNAWTAVYLGFQNQSWVTDAQGHATTMVVVEPPPPAPFVPTPVRIVAALANSVGNPEVETVTLLNPSPNAIDLGGWVLRDKNRRDLALNGTIASGATLQIRVANPMQLSNSGGTITLLDAGGRIIDGVSYTREQANRPGWTIVF